MMFKKIFRLLYMYQVIRHVKQEKTRMTSVLKKIEKSRRLFFRFSFKSLHGKFQMKTLKLKS